jgi:hypothetical protein
MKYNEVMNKRRKIVLASIAKNIGNTFHLDYATLLKAFSDFEIVKWIIIESNSTDNSHATLVEFSSKSSFIQFESLISDFEDKMPRTQVLATARNRYLELVSELRQKTEVDYMVVCDLNNLNNKLRKDSIDSCWNESNWGAVTANQAGPYYDIWALRHKFWNNVDCWESFQDMQKIYGNSKLALWDSIYSKMIRIPYSNSWINVDSAFGGIAIYNTKYIEGCSYVGVNQNGNQVCEHVAFNRGVKENKGDIYINPKMINFKYTDHSRRKLYYLISSVYLIIANSISRKSH